MKFVTQTSFSFIQFEIFLLRKAYFLLRKQFRTQSLLEFAHRQQILQSKLHRYSPLLHLFEIFRLPLQLKLPHRRLNQHSYGFFRFLIFFTANGLVNTTRITVSTTKIKICHLKESDVRAIKINGIEAMALQIVVRPIVNASMTQETIRIPSQNHGPNIIKNSVIKL